MKKRSAGTSALITTTEYLPMSAPGTSPYRRGADDGFIFGVMLCVMFFAGVFSVSAPVLSVVALIIFIAVPFVIYTFLRRAYITDLYTTQLSSLWMQGIMTFICGSLIAGLVAVVYLKWINPDFIADRLQEAIDFYSGSGWQQGEEMADLLQNMVKAHVVPTPIQIGIEMIWLGVFSGSLLSLLMAVLVRARGEKKSK
ncbi:MAG: DUF4199 domain-containing protein [Paramuribaculum sp.]|nr:DUF4199 domain-containing protein [Paramuribaculum sp.]